MAVCKSKKKRALLCPSAAQACFAEAFCEAAHGKDIGYWCKDCQVTPSIWGWNCCSEDLGCFFCKFHAICWWIRPPCLQNTARRDWSPKTNPPVHLGLRMWSRRVVLHSLYLFSMHVCMYTWYNTVDRLHLRSRKTLWSCLSEVKGTYFLVLQSELFFCSLWLPGSP